MAKANVEAFITSVLENANLRRQFQQNAPELIGKTKGLADDERDALLNKDLEALISMGVDEGIAKLFSTI